MSTNKLGRYEILGELGRGAMGVVYRARDPIIDRVVALKTIDLALTGAALQNFEERFFQEARSAGRLNHPNIVTIYDAGKTDGVAYIAMEFLEGVSLREMLDEHPPLNVARIVEIAGQVARGLAYAHEHGVVHRDIKPANIIVLRNRRPKITDFGIARLSEADGVPIERAGSPKYMSPEQVRSDATLDGRSDIFSLGTVLYEMLAGQSPFVGETVPEIMRQVLDVMPAPPSNLNARVPAELDAMVMRMLAKRTEDRFPSARSLFRELRRLEENLDEMGSLSSRTAAQIEQAALLREGDSAAGDNTLVLVDDAEEVPPQKRRPARHVAIYATIAVAAALAVFIPLRLQFSDANATRNAAREVRPAMVTAPAPQVELAAEPAAVAPPAVVPAAVAPPAVAPKPPDKPAAEARKPVASAPQKSGTSQPPRKPPSSPRVVAAAPAPPPAQIAAAPAAAPAPIVKETAKLVFAVSPWGEIYIDGKPRGIAPPLSVLELPPGTHRVEIRNATLMPHLTYLTVRAGEEHRIVHTFVE